MLKVPQLFVHRGREYNCLISSTQTPNGLEFLLEIWALLRNLKYFWFEKNLICERFQWLPMSAKLCLILFKFFAFFYLFN